MGGRHAGGWAAVMVLLVVALRELLGKRGEVVDRKSGKMYELPPVTPPPLPMVDKKKP
jgi:hypothetical protein